MIKPINDPKRTLNLNPLVIYFLLSTEEKQKYEKFIEDLNSQKEFTLGLFKFKAISRSQDPELSVMLDNLIPASGGNMLARFFDRADDAFSYGLAGIDFSSPEEKVKGKIKEEVKDIARNDLSNLKVYTEQISGQEGAKLFSEMTRLLHEALKSDWNSGWRSTYIDSNDLGRSLPPWFKSNISRFKKWGKEKDLDPEVADFFEKFNSLLEDYGISTEEESEEILTYQEKLKLDYYTRNKPETVPEFTIKVEPKLVDKNEHKYNYQFKIAVEGKEVGEIEFPLMDSRIIYLSILLSRHQGQQLLREAFLKNPRSYNPIQQWIRYAYEKMVPDGFFEKWIWQLNENEERRLKNGKAQCKKAIEKALKDHPKLSYYFQIQIEKKGTFVDKFYLNFEPDQIILPPHWRLE